MRVGLSPACSCLWEPFESLIRGVSLDAGHRTAMETRTRGPSGSVPWMVGMAKAPLLPHAGSHGAAVPPVGGRAQTLATCSQLCCELATDSPLRAATKPFLLQPRDSRTLPRAHGVLIVFVPHKLCLLF